MNHSAKRDSDAATDSLAAVTSPELLALEAMDAGYATGEILTGSQLGPMRLSEPFRALFALAMEDAFEAIEAAEAGAYTAMRQSIQDILEDKQAEVQLSLALKAGQQHLDVSFKRVASPQGNWLVIWARDVTKARRDLQRLQQENGRIKQDLKGMGNLLNTLPMPIWMRNPELALKFCNLAYMEAAELAPDAEPDLGHMELYRQAPQLARTAWEKEKPQAERRHFVMGGQRKWFEFNEIPGEDRSFIAGFVADLTELEAMREQLDRHITAQADLLESSASAMAIFGPDKRLRYFNNAYVKLWKLDEAWLGTQPSYREILEVLRDNRSLPEQVNFAVYKQEHAQLFTDLIEPHEEFYYLPDGRTLRVLAIPHALGGLLFAYEDVTDRLALERSYNTLIAVQRATLDHLHEAVAVLGEDGRLKLSNPAYVQLWGLNDDMLTDGPHISDILERTKHFYNFESWPAFKQQQMIDFQHRLVDKQRMELSDNRVLDLLIVPLPDGATLLTYMDMTDSTLLERSLREQNEALEAADKLKSEFLANVSYELRSPLTSISGFAQMLRENYFGALNPKQTEYVDSIHHAAQQLSSLINEILDIASIEAGTSFLDLESTDIGDFIHMVAEQLRPQTSAQDIGLIVEIPDHIGSTLIDTARLSQGLVAVAQGAMKYIERGGAVAIGAYAAGGALRGAKSRDEVILWVEERLPQGTEPKRDEDGQSGAFYRLTASSFRKSGTGLQMSMAKSYVQLHGGRVELASQSDGTTRALFILPR